jgi:hypothetical protein
MDWPKQLMAQKPSPSQDSKVYRYHFQAGKWVVKSVSHSLCTPTQIKHLSKVAGNIGVPQTVSAANGKGGDGSGHQ